MSVKYYTSPLGDEAVESIKTQGFTLPAKPAGSRPELPDDLSDLDDVSLMDLMRQFTAWSDYANAQVGLAVIAERECEMELELVTAQVWRDSLSADPKMSVTVLKTVALTEEAVAKARGSLEDAYAYRRLASDVADRFDKDAQLLSRELTRRTQNEFNARQRRRERWES